MGATEVIDVKCQIAGNAGGKATIRASLHIRTVTFDNKKWKIITLMCSYCGETLHVPGLEGGFGTHFSEPATTLFEDSLVI